MIKWMELPMNCWSVYDQRMCVLYIGTVVVLGWIVYCIWRDRIISDYWEEREAQAYKQGRANAIEECIKIVKYHENEWDGISWAVKELEELKEKKE